MATVSRQTKACQIDRTITVTAQREPWGVTVYATVFEVHTGKRSVKQISDVYVLSRVQADFGIGIRCEKYTGEPAVYFVNLSAGQTITDSCDCPWGCLGRGQFCRHIQLCKEAVKLGLI